VTLFCCVLDASEQLSVKMVFWVGVIDLVPDMSVEERPPEVPEVES